MVVEGSLTFGSAGMVRNCTAIGLDNGSPCAKIGSSDVAILSVGNALCAKGGASLPVATANDLEN